MRQDVACPECGAEVRLKVVVLNTEQLRAAGRARAATMTVEERARGGRATKGAARQAKARGDVKVTETVDRLTEILANKANPPAGRPTHAPRCPCALCRGGQP